MVGEPFGAEGLHRDHAEDFARADERDLQHGDVATTNVRAIADRKVALEDVPATVVPGGVAARTIVDGLATELGGVGLRAEDLVPVRDLGEREVEERDRERRRVGDHIHHVAEDPAERARVARVLERLADFLDDEVDAVAAAHRFGARRLGLGCAELRRRLRDAA